MFVTNWISTTKIQKISEITNFFRHYFLSRTEVYTSVRNAWIDRLRRQSPIDTEISPSDLSGTISDDQAQESSFREAELWTAIELLPERCREIFLMSKRDGMTYREIAEELNLSEKTVEHQISKALKTLRGKKDDFLADFFYILPFIHGGIL